MSATLEVLLLLLCCGLPPADPEAEPEPHYIVRLVNSGGSFLSARDLTFSPDGSTLVVSAESYKTLFIRTQDGEVSHSLPLTPFSMAFSRDGSRLLLNSESSTTLLDAKRLAPVPADLTPPKGYTGLTVESRNGKLLVTQITPGSPVEKLGTIKVGDELVGVGDGKGGTIRSVIGMSVEGARQLIIGPLGTHVRLKVLPRGKTWADAHTVQRQAMRQVGTGYTFVASQPTGVGENLAMSMDRVQRYALRSAKTGQVVSTITPQTLNPVGQRAISPDGQRFALLSYVRDASDFYAVEIFRIATGEQEAFVPFPGKSWYQVAFSPDSSKLLVGTWDTIEILDLEKKAFIEPFELLPKPKDIAKTEDPPKGGGNYGSPSGAFVAQAAADRNAFGGERISPRQLTRFAVSSRGMVAVGEFSTVRLWDFGKKELLYTFMHRFDNGEDLAVDQVGFSPDGKWLAYCFKGELHLVNVSDVERWRDPPDEAAAEGK